MSEIFRDCISEFLLVGLRTFESQRIAMQRKSDFFCSQAFRLFSFLRHHLDTVAWRYPTWPCYS